ncbi:UDP-N-acetylglucosamine 2-epimerase [Candidatus Falkowbacteria bacterium RIFOXYC2_FULL_47_12]|uniref:UDP-N-acetylglucosamine 2-epimerase n=2 Tax=Candidatus Falkowiibacteriota TaxID=1752728 RepID=A0A1F5TNW1_9BACT|nr:MAG: UDP-N-acetylglucosamine 2-epimerase [Candidatus Falkowbacteria bacterium RIFOXYA2_FULL_47_9]OGF40643.1 MAG: UDP-N-acetylglucosamine 2-epimerase [Candidatus Falkowbacteria bacterium RIFOXYC2_FULL_47_12]
MNPDNEPIAIIAGARPNFMKVSPLCRELEKQKIAYRLINTGQHFNADMSGSFFKEFHLQPHYNLHPSHNSIIRQFADIMVGLEEIFLREHFSLVVVVGDVNSTLAGALTAYKMNIPLVHVEAGLRAYNNQMPEEINRVITDRLSSMLFTSSDEAIANLRKEGVTENVHPVGNIMIDTLEMFLPQVKKTNEIFYFCTLHRAENVDSPAILSEIVQALAEIARDAIIYLPLHPRTKKMAQAYGLLERLRTSVHLLEPLGYQESLYYQKNARLVLTDSGGIQEETSYLGTPCITLRTETERPVTVTHGTNTIGGVTKVSILQAYRAKDLTKKKTAIPYWDGKTSKRIVDSIKKVL